MNPAMHEAAMAALHFLASVAERRTKPGDAATAFADVRKHHSAVDMQLVWEREAIGGTHHFDVVIAAPGEGGITVTVAPERGLPFLARGCRGREDQIATVNGEPIGSTNALVELEVAHDAALVDRLIEATLIRQAIERDGGSEFDPTAEELQAGVDGFRKRNALYRASDAQAWLERRGLSLRALEDRLSAEIRAAKLRDRVVGEEVERCFASDPSRFDEWIVTKAECGFREVAETLIQSGSPMALDARAAFLAGNVMSVTTTAVRGHALPAELAGGTGPALLGDSAVIVFAEKVRAAVLDDATRIAVAEHLFRAWLDKRRAASGIEWLWGGVAS